MAQRFYQHAEHVPSSDSGYSILLDGKPVRTPAGNLLRVQSEALAAAVVAEWAGQGAVIDSGAMPLTRLAHITLDIAVQHRVALLAEIVRYLETDLLCYRIPSPGGGGLGWGHARHGHRPECPPPNLPPLGGGAALRARQDAVFDPVLAWVEARYGARFAVTEDLLPVPQQDEDMQKIAAAFAAVQHEELAALSMLTPILGSALLTLAVWKGFLPIEEALVAAHLEEDAHAERYGADPLEVAAWAAKCCDAKACAAWLGF